MKQGLSYDDVLLVPKHGVLHKRAEADISSELVSGWTLQVPIIAANMPSVVATDMANGIYQAGGFAIFPRFGMYENIRALEASFKYGLPHKNGKAGVSIGLDGIERAKKLYSIGCEIFCLDVAHGDHEQVIDFVKSWYNNYNAPYLIVGNVATLEAAGRLADEGVDAIKVGIGPGAACTTREVTGFGVPQLTAVMNCSLVKELYPDVRIIADGGIKNSGDIVKALAAGADTVMVGSLLAGADEAPEPGTYYGNASRRINNHNAPEGAEGSVPLTGPVKEIIKKLAWGIRSGISYGGATNIKELRQNAEFIQVSPYTHIESGVRI